MIFVFIKKVLIKVISNTFKNKVREILDLFAVSGILIANVIGSSDISFLTVFAH